MGTQKPPYDYSQQLYDKYRESFEEYINATVRGCWILSGLALMGAILLVIHL